MAGYSGTIAAYTLANYFDIYNVYFPAYRPIGFSAIDVNGDGFPPVVFADIYVNGYFYKTIQTNTPSEKSYDGVSYTSEWDFDLSGVLQEAQKAFSTDIRLGEPFLQISFSSMYGVFFGMVAFHVLFRSSQMVNGCVVPEGPAPIQRTIDSDPVPGTGFETTVYYALNASVNENYAFIQSCLLETRLEYLKNLLEMLPGTGPVSPHYKLFPLSNTPYMKLNVDDNGIYAFIVLESGFDGSSDSALWLGWNFYRSDDTLIASYSSPGIPLAKHNSIYYMPYGLKNLSDYIGFNGLDTGGTTQLGMVLRWMDTGNGDYYKVVVYSGTYLDTHYPVFVTPKIYPIDSKNVRRISFSDEYSYQPIPHTRLWFINDLGHFDQVNFRIDTSELKVVSQGKEQPLLTTIMPGNLYTMQRGMNRINSRSNEMHTCTDVFNEAQMQWLKELFASTNVFVELNNPVVSYHYLQAIVIHDDSFVMKKWDTDRYQYEVTLKWIQANENIIVRN